MEKISNFLLSLLFPLRCVSCLKRLKRNGLCPDCRERVVIRRDFICPVCRRRLPEYFARCHPKTEFLLFAVSNFSQKEVRELVHSLKYSGQKDSAAYMAEMMAAGTADRLAEILNPEKTFIVPIPLHSDKQKKRGFNQSFLLAEEFVRLTGGRWKIKNLLKRVKNNPSQTECGGRKERWQNVQNIFSATEKIEHQDLILIDDVTTSGATLTEAAKTLKAAGAGRLIALVFAEA